MKKAILFVAAFVLAVSTAWSGETIRVIIQLHPYTDGVKALVPEFEKQTGIKVQLEQYGEDQLFQKLSVEFTASGGDGVDVFSTRPPQEGAMWAKNGWYEDLTPYIEKDPDYDFQDFKPATIEGTRFNGIQACIPSLTEVELLFYRKDLFEAKGKTPPTTFDELEALAKEFYDPATDMAGFVARGQRSALITQFSSYLYSYGGDFFDIPTSKALINTPEFKDAARFYGGLLRKYGPKGVANMHWMQATAIFTQGKAAMYTESSSLYPGLLDPKNSPLADKTGVVVFPKGPKAHKTYDVTSWALAVSSGSSKKDAAWKFIRFMTNKENTAIIQGKYGSTCARQSAFETPEGTAAFPADLVTALADSATIGVPRDRPMVTAVSEARDIIGEVVVAVIEGKDDIDTEAKRAQDRFQTILDREKAEK